MHGDTYASAVRVLAVRRFACGRVIVRVERRRVPRTATTRTPPAWRPPATAPRHPSGGPLRLASVRTTIATTARPTPARGAAILSPPAGHLSGFSRTGLWLCPPGRAGALVQKRLTTAVWGGTVEPSNRLSARGVGCGGFRWCAHWPRSS